jgi:branched-chain amino acid transport system substrate-binding protein
LLASCAPVNNITKDKNDKTDIVASTEILNESNTEKESVKLEEKNLEKKPSFIIPDESLQNNITIILSKKDRLEIVNQFINIIELAVYQKKIQNISFSIKIYENKNELNDFLTNQKLAGKVFIGPLSSSDSDTLHQFCSKGALFFSFSSNTTLAKNCVFLINFFPDNELKTIFKFFPNNSKVALLYPENKYGFGINSIIDNVADQSNSIIINRASYNKDLTNAPEAIKELGKYELRKYELNRQKKILANKKDKESKKRLIKLERFQTTKDFDFTHIIIADYGLRLLQVAPLLPYYDIDPNVVRFVGTGAWDDEVFYDEPSLSGSIYPGIELSNRQQLNDDYKNLYKERLLRISTLPYDLVGLLDYLINNNYTTSNLYETLQNSKIRFAGVDGNFYFLNNRINRDLQVLQIKEGKASVILKQE